MPPYRPDPRQWPERWEAALGAAKRLGGETRPFRSSEPALEGEVAKVERAIGVRIPRSFREIITTQAAAMDFWWQLPDGLRPPEPLNGIFGGDCSWALGDLVELEKGRKGWIESCFPNRDDPYDAVWHDKLAFMEVGNGDMLAIDLKDGPDGRVVYLSHEGDMECHGRTLGLNFADFIERWTRLGCPGPEDWQMAPFLGPDGLDPGCENAALWRSLFFEGGLRAARKGWFGRLFRRFSR